MVQKINVGVGGLDFPLIIRLYHLNDGALDALRKAIGTGCVFRVKYLCSAVFFQREEILMDAHQNPVFGAVYERKTG